MHSAAEQRPVMLFRHVRRGHGLEALAFALWFTAGCAMAPVDEAEKYEREDARIRATEQFEAMQRACRASGGVVIFEGGWGRATHPTPADLRMATCASRAALGSW